MTTPESPEPTAPPPSSPAARARARAAKVQATAQDLGDRAQEARTTHSSVDAAFEMVDHDAEVGGGIMAGALAYRLFIWLLPLTLVAIAGLGFASEAASTSPKEAADSMGLAGLASNSVAAAAKSSARLYAILIGIPVLLYATRSLLQALIVTHRLVWSEPRQSVPKPGVAATVELLATFLGFLAVSTAASSVRHASAVGGLIVVLLIPLPYAALWLHISRRLPHGGVEWRRLVPGALLFGFSIEIVHAATSYFIAPTASSKEGTYGALGVAAALLLGLFIISRVVVASAVMNATLADRRSRDHGG